MWVLATFRDAPRKAFVIALHVEPGGRGEMEAAIPGIAKALKAVGKVVTGWEVRDGQVVVTARSKTRSAACPRCSCWSNRIHDHYVRRVAERPCLDAQVVIEIEVHRFKCPNSRCTNRTFVERIDALARSYQRRTQSHARALQAIGFALGGAAAARLAHELGLRASRQTVLRELHRARPPEKHPPRIIGIDDWAIAKGHHYGTIVVDLESREPIEVFARRETTAVAEWLREHPTVEVVARDRAGAYSEAVEIARPEATQVADRWHLLANLRATVERMLHRLGARLREAAREIELEPAASGRQALRRGLRLRSWQRLSDDRRASRLARYEEVMRRHRQGEGIKFIARAMSLDHRTIRKFIRAGAFPERAPRSRGPSPLDRFRDHIATRVEQGCHNPKLLWDEVRASGYTGGRAVVVDFVARLLSSRDQLPNAQLPAQTMPCPSAARVFGWLAGWRKLNQGESMKEIHHQFVQALCRLEPTVSVAQRITREFLGLIHQRNPKRFDRWLKKALTCGVPELRRFATSLQSDIAAVRAAFSLPWSNGQTEGQINRLKYLKRQMYGRAGLALLRARVLHEN
jgi:transposase